MTAREANDKGHRIGEHSFETEGYEVTYGRLNYSSHHSLTGRGGNVVADLKVRRIYRYCRY